MTTPSTESNQGEQPIDPAWAHDELRLALAMRGGVSLAVWIGGATAEIDTLCRASNTVDGFWNRLARAAGYENVIVDVMSGASAGGLNAVIGAAAATYGFSLDALRDTWIQLGSLSDMVRKAKTSGPGDGMSLLEGDEYFLAKLHDRLTDLVESSETYEPRRIDVTLAATLLEPIAVEQIRNNADTTQLRYMSTFRFRHGSPVWSDFPNDAGRSAALARLALAGRATSSFPAAFEAAAVHAPRPSSFTDFRAAPSENVEMTGVFGEATATGRMFCVMDGGVLDNIPIARAIDAIVDAPADRPTRRVLIYVQPGSSGTSVTAPVREPDRSTAAVLTAIFRTRVQEETIAGDLRQIEEHNARVRRSRLSAAGAVGQLSDSAVVGAPQPPSPRYVSQRAGQEASDVAALLADPISTLGGDPFPQLSDQDSTLTDRCWRSPLSAVWTPAWVEQLPFELAGELETLINESIATTGHALTVGVGPLRRLIHLLIDASRALARCQDTPGEGGDPNELKAALYRLLAVHAEIVERPRQWAWVTLAALRDESAWTPGALSQLEELCAESDQLVGVVDYLDNPAAGSASATPLAAADGVMRVRLDNLVTGQAATTAGGQGVRELILDRLCTHAGGMASAPLNEELLANLAEQGDLGAVVLASLRRPHVNMNLPPRQILAASLGGATAEPGWAERSLARLERATYDPGTVGELGSWPIDFVRLSGANETPLAAAFPRLLGELRRAEPIEDISERLAATPPPLSPTSKLAGNELMNFSAFLRDRWRSNDWMWGRLDAVVTLVETLIEPGRLRKLATAMSTASPDEDPVELLLERFEGIVTTSGTVTATEEWSTFLLETAWLPRRDDISTAFGLLLDNDPDNPPDLGPLRAALIAARQWEILAILLPLGANMSGDDPGTSVAPPPISPNELVTAANEYWVGVETLGNPREPNDGQLVQDLTNAAKTMLAKSTSGPVGKVAGLLAPVVGLLSGVWLHKTWPKVIAAGLVGLGVAGLTVPAWGAAADPLAAVAGPAAVLFLAGVSIAAVRSRSLGFLVAGVAVVVAILAAVSAGPVVLAVSASVVAFVTLIAGAGLVALIRLRPPFPR